MYTKYIVLFRYKYDVYDRIWWPYNYEEWTNLSTSLTIQSSISNLYQPSSVVMSTAATPINDSAPLVFHWNPEDATSKYYIYMHFAEVVKLKANQSRSFNGILNEYLWTFTLYSKYALPSTGGKYVFSLVKTENSTLPPIINAIEVYSVKSLLQSETDQEDGMFFHTSISQCISLSCVSCHILVCKIAIEFYLIGSSI